MASFSLNDYDIISFDHDATIIDYTFEMFILAYQLIGEFLYNNGHPEAILEPITIDDLKYVPKGIILDLERGNALKLSSNGKIIVAFHGTKRMTIEEIIQIYGTECRWQVTDKFSKNPICAWNGELSKLIRSCSDYFDLPAALCFLKLVDLKAVNQNSWSLIMEALNRMYRRDLFQTKESAFFEAIKRSPSTFIKRYTPKQLEFFRDLQLEKKVILISGSHIDFINLTASYALGKDWRKYFDLVICYAKKPAFFSESRPFRKIIGNDEGDETDKLVLGDVYSRGNFGDLETFLRGTSSATPKSLYIGDHLIQDVFAPNVYSQIDTVAVLNPDLIVPDYKCFGNFFHHERETTFWEKIIQTNAKISISKIEVLMRGGIRARYDTCSHVV